MKKKIGKIVACVMAVLMLVGVAACGNNGWQGTTMTNWGTISTTTSADGGFVAETQNYIYFINGFADNTADNTFGTPVKGSLMVAEKSNLANAQVVVPKLFAATDYKSGVYIFGNEQSAYVYYGTPSTDKNNAGETANTELVFMRTSLDGKNSDTFFAVDSLAVEYRFVENNGTVYLVYYDTNETALKSYNTVTGETIVIAKTDTQSNVKAEGEEVYKTLSGYMLAETGEVIYTVTVYTEPYYESAAGKDGYARAEASYNQVYKYVAGDVVKGALAGTCVLDGKASDETEKDTIYTLNFIKEGYLFYKTQPIIGEGATYVVPVNAVGGVAKEVKNTEIAVNTNLMVDENNVYYVKDQFVFKASLLNDGSDATPVANATSISSLLFVEDGNLYFIDSNQCISRVELGNDKADVVRVSEEMVATSWYPQELLDINGTKYLAYLGGADTQSTYVNYVELTNDYVKEDADGDEKEDSFYVTGHKVLGKMLPADEAVKATRKIDAIGSGELIYEVEDGVVSAKAVEKARLAYNALSADAKAVVDASYVTTLENSEKALDIIKILEVIKEDVRNYDKDVSDLAKITDSYNQAKAIVDALGDNYDGVMAKVTQNIKYVYQQAGLIIANANK